MVVALKPIVLRSSSTAGGEKIARVGGVIELPIIGQPPCRPAIVVSRFVKEMSDAEII